MDRFDEQERMTLWAWERERPHLLVSVFEATDQVTHVFWNENSSESMEHVLDIYRRFDTFVGRMRQAVGPDALILVLSDHGFAPVRKFVHLNRWLQEQGYLVLRRRASSHQRIWPGVDWERSRAYALGLSQIYINLRGRERLGCVEPGAERERLCEEIASRLMELRDPESGAPVVRCVRRREELFHGPYVERAADLFIGFHRGYRTSEATAVGGLSQQVFESNHGKWRADHCSIAPELVPGVLLCNHPLNFACARLLDLAVTILDWFGCDPPAGMEGHTLLATP